MNHPEAISPRAADADLGPAPAAGLALAVPSEAEGRCPRPPNRPAAERLDAQVRALAAHLTKGGSVASALLALADWQCHLALSPGKLGAAWGQWLQRSAATAHDLVPGPPEPPSRADLRFAHADWNQWPWRWLRDSFENFDCYVQSLTEDVPGVSPHHARLSAFILRQWVDLFSPGNLWWTNPAVLRSTMAESGQNFVRGVQYLAEDMQDVVASVAEKPQLRRPLSFVVGRDVAITPGKVVYRNELMEVLQYSPATDQVWNEPVLIVPSWILKYYILDLQPQDSLVRYLVEHGHTVFILSWRNPGPEASGTGLEDYLVDGLLRALEVVRRRCEGAQVHAVGYCLGGTLLAIAAALLARDGPTGALRSATLLAAQVDFSEPGELGLFIDHSSMAVLDALMSSQGYLDGWQLGVAFQMLGPRDRLASRTLNEYMLGRRLRANDLVSWNRDATRLPYLLHSECLRRLYLANELARGAFFVAGHPIALADIDVPLFSVATEHDHVSPWESVYKLQLLTRTELTFVLTSGGHNAGIVAEPQHPGRRYRVSTRKGGARYQGPHAYLAANAPVQGSWWPCWQQWLADRSTGRRAARDPSPGALENAPGSYVHQP